MSTPDAPERTDTDELPLVKSDTPPGHTVIGLQLDPATVPEWWERILTLAPGRVRRMTVVEDPKGWFVKAELPDEKVEEFYAVLQEEWVAYQAELREAEATEPGDDPAIRRITEAWLGTLDAMGCASDKVARSWFQKDPDFDASLRERFLDDYKALIAGEREGWRKTAWGLLAYVLVLDQFSRNMFRDDPQMYAADPRCLSTVLEGLDQGLHNQLPGQARSFLFIPLMHSERLSDQERCVAAFKAFYESQGPGLLRDRLKTSLSFAAQHHDIIAKFGRFPHRNKILGRESSADELAFLAQPGSSF